MDYLEFLRQQELHAKKAKDALRRDEIISAMKAKAGREEDIRAAIQRARETENIQSGALDLNANLVVEMAATIAEIERKAASVATNLERGRLKKLVSSRIEMIKQEEDPPSAVEIMEEMTNYWLS